MNYAIVHHTLYDYTEPVSVSYHAARLEPTQVGTQSCEKFSLEISPRPAVQTSRRDYFQNRVSFFGIQEAHRHLSVTARSLVSINSSPPPDLAKSSDHKLVRERFRDPVSPSDVAAYEFCVESPLIGVKPEFADYAKQSFPSGTPVFVGARDLARRIFCDFKYDPRATTVATALGEVWRKRAGVCQDFAHFAIAAMRSLGLPARYVSGYLRTDPPPGKDRLVGADASHAWFSTFCPLNGWVDFDPTNDAIASHDHITVAVGRDFSDVSPLTGILTGGGEHTMSVSVDVKPLG